MTGRVRNMMKDVLQVMPLRVGGRAVIEPCTRVGYTATHAPVKRSPADQKSWNSSRGNRAGTQSSGGMTGQCSSCGPAKENRCAKALEQRSEV